MSWPDPRHGTTDPAYYRDATDPTEAQIRADFTHYYQLRLIAPHGETPDQQQQFTAWADELAARWGRHESPEHRRLWGQLQAAVAGWEARPEFTRAAYNRITRANLEGDLDVEPMVWRNLRQAAEITGHIETTTTGSDQDGARWQPPAHSPERTMERVSVLERALGGSGPELASLAEVDAIIAATDQLLEAEEATGDADSGREERLTRQRVALRQLQDATAEHTRLADAWPGTSQRDQAHLARLETLLHDARTARVDAAAAAASSVDIEAAYHAGLAGTYSHQSPANLPQTTAADPWTGRDATAAEHLVDLTPEPGLDYAAGAQTSEAIDAALPEAGFAAWSPADGHQEQPAPSLEVGAEADLTA
ncbi:hypothetical protein LTT66_12020 [Nocardia gipuzkoensis]|uniref:hypothetical protein n=1 Tax=Nocardia TaxID=1817 RepID=UPI001E3CAB6E|nr:MULTISPECIES: hypothetical protein [Nocardia]UGT70827.1 hypothetical protein LTT66_12020 [Nocardia gipuzkoensis]